MFFHLLKFVNPLKQRSQTQIDWREREKIREPQYNGKKMMRAAKALKIANFISFLVFEMFAGRTNF
jgi:hypothetical protein